MADLASFSLSDRRAAPHSRAHQYRLTAVSAGRTLNNVRGREGGREGRGGGGQGRAGEGRGGEGGGQSRGGEGRGGEGRGGEGRGGDCPHFPQTRTFVTAEPSRPPAKRVTG